MKSDNNHSEQHVDNVFKAISPMASEPNEAFLQQLREQSAQVFTTAIHAPTAQTLWRKIMFNRTLRFAAAAAVICAVLLGINLFSHTESTAYAQVANLLRTARTLAYKIVTPDYNGTDAEISTEYVYRDEDYLRVTTSQGDVTVVDAKQGKQLSLLAQTKQYIEGTFDVNEIIESENTPDDPFSVVASLRALPAEAQVELEEKILDGYSVKGYQVTSGDATTTVWIDVVNGDLVQVEQVFGRAPGMNYVMKDFRFDPELPEGFFALTPPEGWTRMGTLDAGDGGSEETFVAFLRFWTTELTKDGSFPPIVLGPQLGSMMMDLVKQGKFHNEKLKVLDPNKMYQAFIWVANLPKETNWRYLAVDVVYGDSSTPVFWHRPVGQNNYRVVYADLHVAEVLPEDLPQ
ncbi:hypothetical protein ACFL6U_07620 [Planctomycetota bacterium]